MEEKQIGKVTHYFSRINVAIIALTDSLKIGDTIHIKGHSEDFKQPIDSMQIEHKEVSEAKAGDSVGVKVSGKVHENDIVYKV
ncbi:MAG: hypothetical protein AB1629_02680 [Candidatus Omnitrophota bacterium]